MTLKVLALGGDGIGPEVVDAALKLLDVATGSIGLDIDLAEDLLHNAAWDKYAGFVRITNEIAFGLAAGIGARDTNRAIRIADRSRNSRTRFPTHE